MRLPFFRAKEPVEPAHQPRRGKAPKPADKGPVHAARVQARRRLIGALVLLAAGIIGFPILFETQPRPLPVDTPMLVTDLHGGRAASAPTSRPRPVLPVDAGTEFVPAVTPAPVSAVSPAAVAAPTPAASTPPALLASAPAAAPVKVTPMATAPSSAAPPLAAVQAEPAKPAPKAEVEAEARPDPAMPSAPETTPAVAGRFVVQVGAYNDAERLKVARQKVEKLGYKSYTQDVDTTTGKRTRVRVGPFATRQEAEAVAVKVKGAGLQANILVL